MKYLFLIIRHLFPRHRWVIIKEGEISCFEDGGVIGRLYVLRNQFGELREFRVLARQSQFN